MVFGVIAIVHSNEQNKHSKGADVKAGMRMQQTQAYSGLLVMMPSFY